jgi:hypothetical protein
MSAKVSSLFALLSFNLFLKHIDFGIIGEISSMRPRVAFFFELLAIY